MRGLLVRVGIDGTPKYGHWNAPVDADTNRFVFVPISDCSYNTSGEYIFGGKRTFEEVVPELARFAAEYGEPDHTGFKLPERLRRCAMHLDPDFRSLKIGQGEAPS